MEAIKKKIVEIGDTGEATDFLFIFRGVTEILGKCERKP